MHSDKNYIGLVQITVYVFFMDIVKIRKDTPAVEKIIHFNNAGAALSPRQVVDSVINHIKLEAEIGGYEAAAIQEQKIDHFYESVAKLINASTEEIAFAENATRAWDMAFYAIPFKKGDRILTCNSEYASNYIAYLQVAEEKGVQVDVIPNDESGQIDPSALEKMLDDKVKLISITHVPTNGGLINPAEEVGKIARNAGILYLLDACQSIGQMPIDVQKIGCDMLSVTGRKFLRGPRGTGFLYVNKRVIESLTPPFLDLQAAEWVSKDKYVIRKDAKRFENWERYVAGQIGLATAIDYIHEIGIETIWERIQLLAKLLRSKLKEMDNVVLHDLGKNQCGIISFTIKGQDSKRIKEELLQRGINIAISKRIYTLLDMESRHLEDVLRASVHYYNTEEEVERFIYVLKSN